MRAARIADPESGIDLITAAIPAPGPGELLVRSVAVGICGSDLDLLAGTRPPGFATYPVIPGHEWSGLVAAPGPGVTGVAVGTPVAVMGIQACGRCPACRDGNVQRCERGYAEVGFTAPGGLAEWVVIRAEQAVVLPPAVTLDAAALLEPAAVVAHAFLRCPSVTGRTVTVVGDGTLGLLAVQMARASGAGVVTLLGLDDERLALARRLGATAVHRIETGTGTAAPVGAQPADVVVECAGAPESARTALRSVRRGGTVALLGVTGSDVSLGLSNDRLVVDDLTVTGILASTPASWNHALSLVAAGGLDLGALITDRFALADVARAFARAAARPPGTVKVLIEHDHGHETENPR